MQPNSRFSSSSNRIGTTKLDSSAPFVNGKNVFAFSLRDWSDASDVTENRIEAKKRIDDAWWHDYRKQTKLDLAGLNLKSLPNCLIGISNLSELNLVDNPLKELPDLREMKDLQKILVTADVKEQLEKSMLLLPPGCSLISV